MICPRCQTRLDDDTVICESCNFIIDATALGRDADQADGAVVGEDEPPDANRTRVRRIEIAAPQAVAPVEAAVFAGTGAQPSGRLDRLAAPSSSVTDAADDLLDRYRRFPRSERTATAAAAVFLVSLGLPWRWSAGTGPAPVTWSDLAWAWLVSLDNSAVGLFAGAWPLGILALVVCVAAYARRDVRFRPFKDEILLAVLGASSATLVLTALYGQRTFHRVTVYWPGKPPMEQVATSPHIGVGIALVAALFMSGGSVVSWLNRRQLGD